MDPTFIEELRQKYIKDPPEGMTARLVKNMTDSTVESFTFMDSPQPHFFTKLPYNQPYHHT